MLASLWPAVAYGFAAAMTPGPLSMFLFSQAVSNGWRRTLPAAFSPLISDGPVAVLVLAILSQVPDSMIHYLRLAGGVFILYLAFGAWKTWRTAMPGEEISAGPGPNSLIKAAIVNWLNPNVYLGWSIILGPIVLGGWRKSPVLGIGLILAFYMTMIAVMMAMVVVFASTRNLGPRVRKYLMACAALALAGLGLYQLWMGSTGLLARFRL